MRRVMLTRPTRLRIFNMRSLAFLISIILLYGCGEKPQNVLVGNAVIKLVSPAGYCDSENKITLPANLYGIGVLEGNSILRAFESCDKSKKTIAIVASRNPESTYSDSKEAFAVSMSKTYEKLIQSGEIPVPQYVHYVLTHDENASYLSMTQDTKKQANEYSAMESGFTIIKGKMLLFVMVKYSENPIEINKLSELKGWIQEVHNAN